MEDRTIIPLKDDAPSTLFPTITFSIFLINLLVFAIFNLTVYEGYDGALAFFEGYAAVPHEITANHDYFRLITSTFMHAGLMHLAGNMLFLLVFADNLESAFGHIGFIVFYLGCGVASFLAQVISVPDSQIPALGASGAIAGVMGGFMILFPRARIMVFIPLLFFLGQIWLRAWFVLGIWFLWQMFSAYLRFGVDGGGVAFAAHAGGFAAGMALTLPIRLLRGHPDTWQKARDQRTTERPKVDLREMRKARQPGANQN